MISHFSLLRLKIFCFRVYHKINGNNLSICQNLWIFFFSNFVTAGMSIVSKPLRSRVGAMSEKWKKKKDTAWTSESSESYWYWCPTRVVHRYFAKNGVSVQPSKYIGTWQFKHKKIHTNLDEKNWTNLARMWFCLVKLCDLEVSQHLRNWFLLCLLCFSHNYIFFCWIWNMRKLRIFRVLDYWKVMVLWQLSNDVFHFFSLFNW